MASELLIFSLAALLAMLGGFAHLYRTKEQIRLRDYISSGLNTGLAGLGLAMVWFYQFQEQIYILVGFCIFVGLMGPPGVEWVLEKIKKGNFTISFGSKGNLKVEEKDDNLKQLP